MKKRAMLAELINRAKCKGHCKLLAYNCNCTVKLLFMYIYIYIESHMNNISNIWYGSNMFLKMSLMPSELI